MTQLSEGTHEKHTGVPTNKTGKSWLDGVQQCIYNAEPSKTLETATCFNNNLKQISNSDLERMGELRDAVMKANHSCGHQSCIALLKAGYPGGFAELCKLLQASRHGEKSVLEEDSLKLDMLKDHFVWAETANKNGQFAREYAIIVNLATKIKELGDAWLSDQLFHSCLLLTSRLPWGDSKAKVDVLRQLCLLQEQQDNLEDALLHLESAYLIAKNKNWTQQSPYKEIIADYHKICTALGSIWEKVDINHAISLYRRDYDIASEGFQRNIQAVALAKLTALYTSLGDFSKALGLLNNFKVICESAKDKLNLCRTLYLLAEVHEREGNIPMVTSLLEAFQAEMEGCNEVLQHAGTLGSLGRMYTRKGLLVEAEGFFTKAYESSRDEKVLLDDGSLFASLEFCRAFSGVGKGNRLLTKLVSLVSKNDKQSLQELLEWKSFRKGLDDVAGLQS